MQASEPAYSGVRLSDRPILGPDSGPSHVTTAAAYPPAETAETEAPGMFDRVKQLVGLGPASTASAVCYFVCCMLLALQLSLQLWLLSALQLSLQNAVRVLNYLC